MFWCRLFFLQTGGIGGDLKTWLVKECLSIVSLVRLRTVTVGVKAPRFDSLQFLHGHIKR
jgi:hypothetical protein